MRPDGLGKRRKVGQRGDGVVIGADGDDRAPELAEAVAGAQSADRPGGGKHAPGNRAV